MSLQLKTLLDEATGPLCCHGHCTGHIWAWKLAIGTVMASSQTAAWRAKVFPEFKCAGDYSTHSFMFSILQTWYWNICLGHGCLNILEKWKKKKMKTKDHVWYEDIRPLCSNASNLNKSNVDTLFMWWCFRFNTLLVSTVSGLETCVAICEWVQELRHPTLLIHLSPWA